MSVVPSRLDRGPRIGTLHSGPRDAISDVAGLRVGHCTLDQGAVQTGVSVILPHAGDLFMHKVPAAAAVFNGFGKSMGLMQVAELGVLESPIALCGTLAVGTVATALTRAAIAAQPEIARSLPTLNAMVLECNDGYLNDAQAFALQESHVLQAVAECRADFAQGSVGAGRGMSCFGLKGGIGSASRLVRLAGTAYTLGALVLANYGRPEALTLAGRLVGPALQQRLRARALGAPDAQGGLPERGSIILVLATDAPLDARQLRRVASRAGVGLARTGSDWGHGSGDLALALSTAYTLPQRASEPMPATAFLHESLLDGLFQAAAEASEQAIVHALFAATTVRGRDGHERLGLSELWGAGL